MSSDDLLKYLPVLNVIGVVIYYLIIRKVEENVRSSQRIELMLTTTVATLAAHAAEDLRQFSRIREELVRITTTEGRAVR